MALKLIFEQSPSALGTPRPDEVIEGKDAEEILDRWNDTPEWRYLDDPYAFREHIVWWTGADIALPAMDDEILEAIVKSMPNCRIEEE